MKKIVIYLTALLLISNVALAQIGDPIQPRIKAGYTKKQIYDFATGSSQLSRNYRAAIRQLVSDKLRDAGVDNDIDIDIQWILQHVDYKERTLSNFRNSHRFGDKISFYNDTYYNGTVGVFSYKGCVVPIFKVICMNLLDVALESTINGKDLERRPDEPVEDNRQQADNYDETDYDDNRNYNDNGFSEEVRTSNTNSDCSGCGKVWYGPNCRPIDDPIVQCPAGHTRRIIMAGYTRPCGCRKQMQSNVQTYSYTDKYYGRRR